MLIDIILRTNQLVTKMKILVLNDSDEEFAAIKSRHPYDEVFLASRYLQFLHCLETDEWDLVYLDDEISDITEPDVWVDGHGMKRYFTGLHAARFLSEIAGRNKGSIKEVIITSSSTSSHEMFQTLRGKMKVSYLNS